MRAVGLVKLITSQCERLFFLSLYTAASGKANISSRIYIPILFLYSNMASIFHGGIHGSRTSA